MKGNDPKVPPHPPLGGPNGRLPKVNGHRLWPEKVTRLRAAIAEGSYRVDVHDVARMFLRELFQDLLA